MTDTLIINLPFDGFYGSIYSGEIDSHEERECEYMAERDGEEGIAPELRLEAHEYAEMLTQCVDYDDLHRRIAEAYVDAFDSWAWSDLDLQLGLKFESMDSPREYNFHTDRVYARISLDKVRELFAISEADGHNQLRSVLKERHTSYDGFHSYYSNNVVEWLGKDLEEWDHNELCSLLQAVLLIKGADSDWRWDVYYAVCDGDGIHQDYDAAMDWSKFNQLVTDAREEKREQYALDHPDTPPPEVVTRCPHTLDLFRDAR